MSLSLGRLLKGTRLGMTGVILSTILTSPLPAVNLLPPEPPALGGAPPLLGADPLPGGGGGGLPPPLGAAPRPYRVAFGCPCGTASPGSVAVAALVAPSMRTPALRPARRAPRGARQRQAVRTYHPLVLDLLGG